MGFALVELEQALVDSALVEFVLALVGSALVELVLALADSVLVELVLAPEGSVLVAVLSLSWRWWILRLLRELYKSSSGVSHVS